MIYIYFLKNKKKDSPWTDIISDAILKLDDNGQLVELYLKWWKNEEKLNCDLYEQKSSNTQSLTFNGEKIKSFFKNEIILF